MRRRLLPALLLPALGKVKPWYLSGGVPAANCLAAYKPLGAADLAASYINLANPGTYDGTPINVPVWDAANGWKGALDWAVDTGINGGNGYSCIIRFTNLTPDSNAIFGEVTTGQTNLNVYGSLGGASYWRNGGKLDGFATAYTQGVLGITPAKAYAAGLPLGALVGTLAGATTNNIIILGWGDNGGVALSRVYVQAFAIYDITLSDARVLAISTAMAALA